MASFPTTSFYKREPLDKMSGAPCKDIPSGSDESEMESDVEDELVGASRDEPIYDEEDESDEESNYESDKGSNYEIDQENSDEDESDEADKDESDEADEDERNEETDGDSVHGAEIVDEASSPNDESDDDQPLPNYVVGRGVQRGLARGAMQGLGRRAGRGGVGHGSRAGRGRGARNDMEDGEDVVEDRTADIRRGRGQRSARRGRGQCGGGRGRGQCGGGRGRGRGQRGGGGGRGQCGGGRGRGQRGGGRGRGQRNGDANTKSVIIEWKKENLEKTQDSIKFTGDNVLPQEVLDLVTPYQFFKYYFTSDLMEHIANQTILYSVQERPERPIDVDAEDIEKFISSLLWISLMPLPHSRLYWSSKFRYRQVAELLPLNRWEEIKRFLHFNDNSTAVGRDDPGYDKLHKVRPLLDSIRQKMLSIPKEEHLSVDEQIIPFKGQSSLKQYLRNKPHKWGYKVFVISGVSGLCYDFELYTGRENAPLAAETDCGKSGNVVIRLTRTVPRNVNYKVYFDNYFNSPALQVYLGKLGILAVGTVRQNRVPDSIMGDDKALKAKGRGSSEENVATVDGQQVTYVKWFDNKCVNLLSTYAGTNPLSKAKRWFASEKVHKEIDLPDIVSEYNKHMGGVDLLDSLNGLYRNRLRSKKWYFRIFTHFVDMVVVTSWLLMRRVRANLQNSDQLDNIPSLPAFKVDVAECLALANKAPDRKRGRPSREMEKQLQEKRRRGPMKPFPQFDVRTDQLAHWPEWTDERERCKLPNCKGQSRVKCSKCNVSLCFHKHENCFVTYHTIL